MGRQFDFGRAFGHMFQIIWRNAGVLVVFGLVFAVLSFALLLATGVAVGASGLGREAFQKAAGSALGFGYLAFQGFAIAFETAVVCWLAMKPPEERTPFLETFREAVLVGMRQVLPVIAIALLSIVPIFLASLLFFVPGVILRLVWFVNVPAQVNENVGVFASFGRSAELTRDNRLVIFAFSIVTGIVLTIGIYAAFLVAALVAATMFAPIDHSGAGSDATGWMIIVLLVFGSVVFSGMATLMVCLFLAAPAAVYRELRLIKDPPARAVASVFA